MRKFMLLALPLLLAATLASAQEISNSQFTPAQLHRIFPDAVVYRILMRQAAAFKQRSDDAVSHGKDGSAYYAHFEQKYGLRSDQVVTLMNVARDHQAEVAPVEQQMKSESAQFLAAAFPGGKLPRGQAMPSPPAELHQLELKRDSITLRARDRFRAALGESEFARIDALIKRQLNVAQADRGNGPAAYGYTSINFAPSTNRITAYSETDEDAELIPFYTPHVQLKIVDQNGAVIASSPDVSDGPGTDATVTLTAGGTPGMIYTAKASHYLTLGTQYYSCGQDGCRDFYLDYFNEGKYAELDILDPSLFAFFGIGPRQPQADPKLLLGGTYDTTATP